jgi:hypothetical protein
VTRKRRGAAQPTPVSRGPLPDHDSRRGYPNNRSPTRTAAERWFQPLASASAGKRVAPASACVSGRVARDNRRSRFRQGHCGNLSTMKKWRYALFGWVAWKVTKRFVRRKLP